MNRRQFITAAGAAIGSRALGAASKPPNIIFILCDDLGYGDLGCYGSRIRTPNLDRMAAEGVRSTDFCSADPVCSPSRAALLTGRYPTRVGVPRVFFPQDQGGLNLDETTLADMLKARNYKTMCIGKWHLGRPEAYLPTHRGFDEYFGIPYSNDMSPRVLLHNTEVIEQTAGLDTLTQRYTARAVKFIADSKSSPFFLYMPHTYPHIPLGASPEFRGKSEEGLYGDVVQELDWSVGEVLKAVRQNGTEDNTLVMFSSDNGPWYQGKPGQTSRPQEHDLRGWHPGAFYRAVARKDSRWACIACACLNAGHLSYRRPFVRRRASRKGDGWHRYLADPERPATNDRAPASALLR